MSRNYENTLWYVDHARLARGLGTISLLAGALAGSLLISGDTINGSEALGVSAFFGVAAFFEYRDYRRDAAIPPSQV